MKTEIIPTFPIIVFCIIFTLFSNLTMYVVSIQKFESSKTKKYDNVSRRPAEFGDPPQCVCGCSIHSASAVALRPPYRGGAPSKRQPLVDAAPSIVAPVRVERAALLMLTGSASCVSAKGFGGPLMRETLSSVFAIAQFTSSLAQRLRNRSIC